MDVLVYLNAWLQEHYWVRAIIYLITLIPIVVWMYKKHFKKSKKHTPEIFSRTKEIIRKKIEKLNTVTTNESYDALTIACMGDKAKVYKLLFLEMKKDKNLTEEEAALKAIARLQRDRE